MKNSIREDIVISAIFVIIGALSVKGVVPLNESGRHGCGMGCVWIGLFGSFLLPFGHVDWKYYITKEHTKVASDKLTLKEGTCQGLFSFGIVGIMLDAINIVKIDV
ncbi:hypothetical protein, partial [Hydrogenimonas sp.]